MRNLFGKQDWISPLLVVVVSILFVIVGLPEIVFNPLIGILMSAIGVVGFYAGIDIFIISYHNWWNDL